VAAVDAVDTAAAVFPLAVRTLSVAHSRYEHFLTALDYTQSRGYRLPLINDGILLQLAIASSEGLEHFIFRNQ
jgi:hypothetical protein